MATEFQGMSPTSSTDGSNDNGLGSIEDEEREDDDVSDIPSPPTPSIPRMMTDGSTPPERHNLLCEMNNQENNADVSDDEEINENEAQPCPNPPTPVKTTGN